MARDVTETVPPQRAQARRPLLKRPGFWVPVGAVVLVLIVLGAIVALLAPRAIAAKDALESAIPLAEQAKSELLAGDTDAAGATVGELAELTAVADHETDFWLWRSVEWVPVVGENLKAVRVASGGVHRLTEEAIAPMASLSFEVMKPVDGAINLDALTDARSAVDQAAASSLELRDELDQLNDDVLIEQVAAGVVKLDAAVAELDGIVRPAQLALQVIPTLLGSEGPRDTLMMFQNNAETRTTGGNPAAVMMLHGEGGRLSISQQASSSDLAFGRPEPILPLNPESEALYTDRIGRWAVDLTFTPDLNEQAALLRAFWAEAYGDEIDGVASFDPVALSYLLEATGPLTLETGDVLTAENAVSLLLNEVYFRYEKNDEQDLFFASAARSVFEALTGGDVDVRALVDALGRAAADGRLMYHTEDSAVMEALGASPIAGPLPATNDEATVLGVFINDQTIGKVQYYLQNAVTAETTQCQVAERATFTATSTVTNTMTPEEYAVLPPYILAGGPMIERGVNAVDVIFYGPVGTEFVEITGDGAWGNIRTGTHLGRPVVQALVEPGLLETVSVTATFIAGAEQQSDTFGPFETRTTPLPHTTPVTVARPGCE